MRPLAPATAILIGEITVFPWLSIFRPNGYLQPAFAPEKGTRNYRTCARGAKPDLWQVM
jgi:hypothetical protein